MNDSVKAARRILILLPMTAMLTLAVGCDDTVPALPGGFANPTGLVVAGLEHDTLFIANRDNSALQIMTIGETLDDLDLVAAPAQFFPLRISLSSPPESLAATPDGKFVVSLSTEGELLSLIDATSRLPVSAAGSPMEFAITDASAAPSTLLASPSICPETGCAGRFYVSLTGSGAIAAIDVMEGGSAEAPDAAAHFVLRSTVAVGGAPTSMAVHPDGTLLFVADGAAANVTRLTLETGATLIIAVGAVAGPMAVTRDGLALVVGRPSLRDIIVVADAQEPVPAVVNTDARLTPRAACLPLCTEDPVAACGNVHPADEALCVSDSGIESTATPYEGLYVNGVPAQIITLGAAAGDPALRVPCSVDDEESEKTWVEFAVVATLDGQQYTVGLRAEDTADITPTLSDIGWCRPPELEPLPDAETDDATTPAAGALAPSTFLDLCPSIPELSRFTCVEDDEGTSGVVALAGVTGSFTAAWRWEGIINDALDAVNGGGAFTDDGRFIDATVDFSKYNIRPADAASGHRGDILEILSSPVDTPECIEALGAATIDLCAEQGGERGCCALERRIVRIDDDLERGALVLDSALPVVCFRGSNSIQYRIRAGDTFLVTTPSLSSAHTIDRMAPGDTYGPGFEAGYSPRAVFRVKDIDLHPEIDACDRYDAQGGALPPLDPVLSRVSSTFPIQGVVIKESLHLEPAGRLFATDGSVSAAGRLPGAMVVAPKGADGPVVFVSYSATHSILAFSPFDADPAALFDGDNQRLIR